MKKRDENDIDDAFIVRSGSAVHYRFSRFRISADSLAQVTPAPLRITVRSNVRPRKSGIKHKIVLSPLIFIESTTSTRNHFCLLWTVKHKIRMDD